MKDHKSDVLLVLAKSKGFVLELKGSKRPLKELCIKLDVHEEEFNKLFKLHENDTYYESDANSDGDLRWYIIVYYKRSTHCNISLHIYTEILLMAVIMSH